MKFFQLRNELATANTTFERIVQKQKREKNNFFATQTCWIENEKNKYLLALINLFSLIRSFSCSNIALNVYCIRVFVDLNCVTEINVMSFPIGLSKLQMKFLYDSLFLISSFSFFRFVAIAGNFFFSGFFLCLLLAFSLTHFRRRLKRAADRNAFKCFMNSQKQILNRFVHFFFFISIN